MAPPRSADLRKAETAAETWISASCVLRIISSILHDPRASRAAKEDLLFQLAQLQYACELAYSRLLEDTQGVNPQSGRIFSFGPLLRRSADAHHLLVSTSGFWRTLRRLHVLMPFAELEGILESEQGVVSATTAARNHIEHIAERLADGRRSRAEAPEMTSETFRKAIGMIDFPRIVFGSESFDLEDISTRVLVVGADVAGALEQTFNSGLERYVRTLASPREDVG